MTEASARRYVKKRCQELGATLENDAVGIHYEIRIEAPHRTVWKACDCHELIVARYGAYNWNDCIDDVTLGVRPCEDVDCEWCNNI